MIIMAQGGSYQEEWTKAKLFTIYKKGPKLDPRNYRGISILSFMAKLYDSVLNTRLGQWFTPMLNKPVLRREVVVSKHLSCNC